MLLSLAIITRDVGGCGMYVTLLSFSLNVRDAYGGMYVTLLSLALNRDVCKGVYVTVLSLAPNMRGV